ncbi:unnamed protein product [Periconia digitata]|uniref:Transmembrane protein n=1 Tax=Periconia digitata TaxID=1303443 RepID=A0A9W4UPZ2_9PLEO|nr:unnamed protein product [Periconia digitata]
MGLFEDILRMHRPVLFLPSLSLSFSFFFICFSVPCMYSVSVVYKKERRGIKL